MFIIVREPLGFLAFTLLYKGNATFLLTMIFTPELFIINPPGLRMCYQYIFITQVRSNFWVKNPRSDNTWVVRQVADDDRLVDGEPDLHTIPVQRVDHAGVVRKPVTYEGISPATWNRNNLLRKLTASASFVVSWLLPKSTWTLVFFLLMINVLYSSTAGHILLLMISTELILSSFFTINDRCFAQVVFTLSWLGN